MGVKQLRGGISTKSDSQKDFKELKQNITEHLVQNNAALINDVEKKIIPYLEFENKAIEYLRNEKIECDEKDLVKALHNAVYGYDILQSMIDADDISDIRVINFNNIIIKRNGKKEKTKEEFASIKEYNAFLNRIANRNNKSIDVVHPEVVYSDTRNPNFFLRVRISTNPINNFNNSLIIRKIPRKKKSLADLTNLDMMDSSIMNYIQNSVKSDFNITVCGAGGAGKTTLINAMMEEIEPGQSNLVVQNDIELFGEGDFIFKSPCETLGITLNDLLLRGLEEDIDRYILSETKGAAALNLFNAMMTGHIAWTSVHSVDCSSAPLKLVHYMKESGTNYSGADLLQMLSVIDLIIFMKDFKVAEIVEVSGWDHKDKRLIFNKIYEYENHKFVRKAKSCEKILSKLKVNKECIRNG